LFNAQRLIQMDEIMPGGRHQQQSLYGVKTSSCRIRFVNRPKWTTGVKAEQVGKANLFRAKKKRIANYPIFTPGM